jgi:hypothetical protein
MSLLFKYLRFVDAVLKLQTVNVCPVKLKNNPSFGATTLVEISANFYGYISTSFNV